MKSVELFFVLFCDSGKTPIYFSESCRDACEKTKLFFFLTAVGFLVATEHIV